MAKRLFAALLCVAMVFSLLPTFAAADGEHTHDSQVYTAHSSGTVLPTESGFYYLTTDIALPATHNTYGQSYSGKTTTICLNGHSISRRGTGRIFNITGTSNLTICDCSQNPGTISGGNMNGNGGMANVASGGVLTLRNVIVSGNTGTAAGAVSTQGKVTLEKVTFTGNTNTAAGGSAVYAATGSDVTMIDCTVTGNNSKPTSANYNGAVYVTNGNAKLTVAGSTVISGNTICNGTAPGDLLLQDAGTKLTVGQLTEGANINLTTEVKKFGTASAASDFLTLAANVDTAKLAEDWQNSWLTYANTNQAVSYTADGFAFAAVSGETEEGHANTEGYDKAGHGTISWKGVSTMAEINNAASGHYYLKNDLDMAGVRLTVKNDVTICLNGYTMDRGAAAGGYARAIHINAGAKLTICDCTAHEKDGTYTAGKITGGWAAEGSGAYVAGTLTLYDGIFTGNKTETYNDIQAKGVIAVLKDAAFHMYGGEISGNTSTGDGAGVYLLNQTGNSFTMTGGTIKNNTADGLGGGVYLANSNATIGGDAVITGNTAGGRTSNLYLPTGVTFKASDLTEKASIGFTMASEPGTVAASGVKRDTVACFVNDNASSEYSLLLNGSRLVLGVPRTGLEHPVAGYDKCGHGDENVTWLNWGDEESEQGSLPTASGHYYLSGDVTLSATTAVSGDASVVLCLNGYSVTGNCVLLQVGTGAAFTVCDCVETGQLTGSPAVVVSGGSFTFADGYITGCTVTGNATNTGAVRVDSGTFTMEGGYIIDNPIHGVYVGGGVFNLSGGEISGNTADTNGGGIRMRGGVFNMTGGVITGNSTTGSGGGSALAVQSGTANITGGEIYGNTANSGGTIYSAGTLNITGVTIRDNTAVSNGGAVYIGGGTATLTDVTLQNNQSTGSTGGGLFVGGGEVTVTGGKITGNSAIYGGGVRVNNGTVTLNQVEITKNTATSSAAAGGGINIKGGNVTVSGGSITGNHAQSKGGGIYMDAETGSLTLTDAVITGNTASVEGGGIYSAYAKASLLLGGKTVITDNTVNGTPQNLDVGHQHNVTLDSKDQPLTKGAKIGVYADLNKVLSGGRLIAAGADQKNVADFFVSDQNQEFQLRGTELWLVLGASATHQAHASDECGHKDVQWQPWLGDGTPSSGHYYLIQDIQLAQTVNVTEGEITICLNGFDIIKSESSTPDFNRIFRVSGGELNICDCKGTGHLSGGTACQGSVIFINGEGAEVNLYGGIISGNTSADSKNDPATTSLGTVCVINGTFSMYGGAISDNTSVRGSAVSVYKEGAVFNLYDGKITNNVSTGTGDTDSGAIHMTGGEVNLLGGEISGNKGNYGGAIRASRGRLTIEKTVITGNEAYLDGGAVYVLRSQITMTGGKITGNTAGNAAGGMAIGTECEAKLTGGEISNNTAKGRYAGGLIVQGTDPEVLLDGVTISGNTSGENGGGVYVGSGKVTLASGTISGNSAKYGAGMRLAGGETRITGGTISGNKASEDGGGIYSIRAKLTVTGGTIKNNTAKTNGGGLALGSGTEATLSGGSATGNRAGKRGGGLIIHGKEPVVNFSGIQVTGNTAGDQGGGMHIHTGTVNMTAGKISGNTAKYGAGVRIANGSVTITGGTLTGNKASDDGGAIYCMNAKLTIRNISISDNTAGKNGAGLTLGTGTKASLENVKIFNNTAGNYGGGIMMQGTEPAADMTGCVVSGNTAVTFGGGIAVYRGSFSAEDITITDNEAGYGGGFYTGRATKADLKNYTIENNYATNDGGGLYLLRSPVTLDTGVIRGNTADTNGGGLSAGTDTVVKIIGKTTITGNTAGSGGGMMVQGSRPEVHVGDGTNEVLITDNKVGGSGGGIRAGVNQSGILNLTNVTVSGNHSNASEPGASGSGIYYSTRVTSLYQNVVITDNCGAGLGGGMHVGYLSDVTMRNCQITNNSCSGNGGGFYLLVRAKVTLEDSVVSGNQSIVRGGGAVIQGSALLSLRSSTLENNSCATGTVYVESAGKLEAVNSTITGNTVTKQASAIYANGSVYLTDSTITGNTDEKGGCAVYLDNANGDGESYIPGVNQFRGKVVIADNEGGELVFAENACLNIYGDGLAEGTQILVDNPDGGITELVVGPYDYVREGDRYTLTPGDKSLSEADPVTKVIEDETDPTDPSQPTEPDPQTQPGTDNTMMIVIIGVIALAVILSVLAVIFGIKKKNSDK